jgi:serine/threonine-protein phosphatase 5
LDPKYVKAYYRRGSAHYALGQLKIALKDFKAVIAIVPNDHDALRKYKQCEKDIRAEAFQKAIESDQPLSELVVDFDSIFVEETYKGPRLVLPAVDELPLPAFASTATPDVPFLSVDFVKDVMAHFRDQKTLHRK